MSNGIKIILDGGGVFQGIEDEVGRSIPIGAKINGDIFINDEEILGLDFVKGHIAGAITEAKNKIIELINDIKGI